MPRTRHIVNWYVQPLRRGQISTFMDNGVKVFQIENMPVLKRKAKAMQNLDGKNIGSYKLRTIKLPYEPYKDFIKVIEDWLNCLPDDPDTIVFDMTRANAWRCMKLEFNAFCHFFRHCRATDITKLTRNPILVKKFFAWAKHQDRYEHIITDDVYQAISHGIQQQTEQNKGKVN